MKLPDYDNKHLMFGMIFILSNRLQTVGDNFYKEITAKQWFVLMILGTMENHSPTLNELSEAVGSSHQNVRQIVNKLQKNGFIEIMKDGEDGRCLRIRTTQKYLEFSQNYEERSNIFLDKMFQGLSEEELAHTVKVLVKLQENVEGVEEYHVK